MFDWDILIEVSEVLWYLQDGNEHINDCIPLMLDCGEAGGDLTDAASASIMWVVIPIIIYSSIWGEQAELSQ